jgi:putative transcriptional regulator
MVLYGLSESGRNIMKQSSFSHKVSRVSVAEADLNSDIPYAGRDSRPYTAEEFGRMRIVPRVKTFRTTLRLTLEEFAERYQIPIGTLRDWEQSRAEPDATARTYLSVIAGDPEGVVRALACVPKRPPAS